MRKEINILKKKLGELSILLAIAFGMVNIIKSRNNKIEKMKDLSDKYLKLFFLMNQWVKVKQEGKNLAQYFEQNNYHNLAIYGMGDAGQTLLAELDGTNIYVAYAIDKNPDRVYANINLISPEDSLKEVDAIIVTAITFFDEIEESLREKVSCPIISLEDILYDV